MEKIFLLIDDDIDDAALFREALSEVDSLVVFHHAANGKEALGKLDVVNPGKPDIIFMDVNMPIMNGWQCLSTLKSAESYKDIPVIIYSTTSYQREVDIAFDLGALCFFTKPRDFKELKVVLKIISENLNGSLLDALADSPCIKCQ